jgi:hypothetical protein
MEIVTELTPLHPYESVTFNVRVNEVLYDGPALILMPEVFVGPTILPAPAMFHE